MHVVALVSAGRHPMSGRLRRAPADASAVELALRLPGVRVELVHASASADGEAVLREYLGMGNMEATLLECSRCEEIPDILLDYLANKRPDLVFAGAMSEVGPAQGLLPYALAQALDSALLPAVCELSVRDSRVEALQSLAKAQRRRLRAALPCIATVSTAGPVPRPFAYAQARRAQIRHVRYGAQRAPSAAQELVPVPVLRKPKRLASLASLDARARLDAATRPVAGQGALLMDVTPHQAAIAILDYLHDARIAIRATPTTAGDRHESDPN